MKVRIVPALPALLAAAATLGSTAWANDRPFQVARTAVMEDDEYVWSMESWVQRYGSVRGLSIEPEYTFGAGTSVQAEVTRLVDRNGGMTGHEAEVEFKHIFNHIGRDGWGLAISGTLATARGEDDGRSRSMALKLPLSIALGDSGGLLHLNAGVEKSRGERRSWSTSAAAEHEVCRRTTLFVELVHEGDSKFGQIGVRHWIRREKLAVDFALQQQRTPGQRASGFIVGIGWYDL